MFLAWLHRLLLQRLMGQSTPLARSVSCAGGAVSCRSGCQNRCAPAELLAQAQHVHMVLKIADADRQPVPCHQRPCRFDPFTIRMHLGAGDGLAGQAAGFEKPGSPESFVQADGCRSLRLGHGASAGRLATPANQRNHGTLIRIEPLRRQPARFDITPAGGQRQPRGVGLPTEIG